jgi:hypothetical protein
VPVAVAVAPAGALGLVCAGTVAALVLVPTLVVVEELELVLVLVALVEVESAGRPALFEVAVGTVNVGAPAVLVEPEPLLPQASRHTTAATTAASAASGRGNLPWTGLLAQGRSVLTRGSIWSSPTALRSRAAPFACRNAGSR